MNYKIKEISEIINGSTPSTSNSDYWDGNITWLTPKDLTNYSSRYIYEGHATITLDGYNSCSTKLVPEGTILLSSRAPIGYLAIAGKELCTNQGFKSIICNKSIVNNLYLYYWLSTKVEYLQSISNGATFKELSKETLENVEIDLPDLKVQQHIVNTIGTVDDLIENLNKQYQKILDDSLRLFELFEGSSTIYFSDAFKSFNGGTFQSKYYVQDSNNKLITIKNVDDAGFNASSVSYLSDERIETKYLLHPGDVLLTMTGNIGRTGIVDEENCYLNQRVLKLQAKSKLYLLCYLIKYKQEIIQLGKGTAQLNLSLEDLNNLVVRNTINEIENFAKNDVIFNRLLNVKLQIKKLRKIKNDLLSKYF